MGKPTLADLYRVGQEATISDGTNTVKVWIQKMNPVEHQRAITKAGAARARKQAYARDRDSDEFLAARSDLNDFTSTPDELAEIAFSDEIAAKTIAAQAELEADEEWAKDGYLDGLLEAWEGDVEVTDGDTPASRSVGLKLAYQDPDHDDHDEAVRVFGEIKRFTDQLEKIVAGERARIIADAVTMDRDALIDKAAEVMLERRASTAFLEEYQDWEMFLSVRRVDDHHKPYFATRDDIDMLAEETKAALSAEIVKITVEPQQGKDSEEAPPSSPSPEQPSTADPELFSTETSG